MLSFAKNSSLRHLISMLLVCLLGKCNFNTKGKYSNSVINASDDIILSLTVAHFLGEGALLSNTAHKDGRGGGGGSA